MRNMTSCLISVIKINMRICIYCCLEESGGSGRSDWSVTSRKSCYFLLHSIIMQRRYDNITCVDCGMSINVQQSLVGMAVIMQTTPTVPFAAVDWNSIVHARDVVVPPLSICRYTLSRTLGSAYLIFKHMLSCTFLYSNLSNHGRSKLARTVAIIIAGDVYLEELFGYDVILFDNVTRSTPDITERWRTPYFLVLPVPGQWMLLDCMHTRAI